MTKFIDANKIEPEVSDIPKNVPLEIALQYSMAISLKRIADILTKPDGLKAHLDIIANHPMNHYGESFSEAIQNAIVRGKNGINY